MNNFQNPYQSPYRFNQTYMNYQNPVSQQMPAFQQGAYLQDGTIPARFVSGKEEAVASNVLPGSMFLFYDRAHNTIYVKAVDPQTGMAEFRTYQDAEPVQTPQERAPEYVSMEMFNSFKNDLERRFESFQINGGKKTGKAASEDV